MGPSLEIKSLLLKLKKQVPRVCVMRALLNKVVAAFKNAIDWLNTKPTVFITSFQRGSNEYGSWSRYILCNNHIPVRTVATSLHVLSEAAARSSALLLLSLPSLIGSNTFAEKVTAAEHSHASRTQKGVLTHNHGASIPGSQRQVFRLLQVVNCRLQPNNNRVVISGRRRHSE